MTPSSEFRFESAVLFNEQWSVLEKWMDSSRFSKVVIFCDSNSRRFCLPYVLERLGPYGDHIFEMKPGEQHKTLETAMEFWSYARAVNLDRDGLLIGLGGGVVTDLAGFVASIWKRGVNLVQIPTTLMAMADASVGAKTGVDFLGLKNILGSFYAPHFILVDPVFLKSLPQSHYHNGSVELIKYYLLQEKDGLDKFVSSLRSMDPEFLDRCIRESIHFKQAVVNRDPVDQGERKILNLGHTIGHAVESWGLSRGFDILHGEAVALGLWIELLLSEELYQWDPEITDWIGTTLSMYFPARIPGGPEWFDLLPYLTNDKKREGGMLRFSMLESPGMPVWNVPVELSQLEKILAKPRFPSNFAGY